MDRIEKIKRLVAVNFSATELSRQSNELLDATYEAAKPLMAAKEAEIRRVVNRTNSRSNRLKAEIANHQRNQRAETEWLIGWKPKPPICTINQDIQKIETHIREYRATYDREKELFRTTGLRCHANDANKAMMSLTNLEGHLVHMRSKNGEA